MKVFQVSAQQRISYLRLVELQQAAAPGLQSLKPHPHPPSVWSVSSLVHWKYVIDYTGIVMAEW